MGLVYAYLAAWILGGVLLGSLMLLQHPTERAAELIEAAGATRGPPDAPRAHAQDARSWNLQLLALVLTGFGLGGLLAEGAGLVSAPWTAACALGGALVIGAGGYLAGRSPRRLGS